MTTVLIVDDHMLSRKGIVSILSERDEYTVIGEAVSGDDAYEKALELRPELIMMDIRMSDGNGLTATRRIKQVMPQVKIIMLSVSDDVQDFFEAMKVGAQGYLLKNMDPETWLDYIDSIVQGEAPVSRALAMKILQEFASVEAENRDHKADALLSEREKELLRLVTQGYTNRKIAETLYISESTVKNHLRNILDKLQLNNRTQLVAYAYKNKMVD